MTTALTFPSLPSIIGDLVGGNSALRAQVLQRAADFYKLSATITAQGQQLTAYERVKGATITAGQRAMLAAAQTAAGQARASWNSTNTKLQQVTMALNAPAPDYGTLVLQVPPVIAGIVATQQLVDAGARLTTNLLSGLTPAEQQQLTAKPAVIAGLSLGGILLIGGGLFLFLRRRRSR